MYDIDDFQDEYSGYEEVESYLLGMFLTYITLGAICRMKEIFFLLKCIKFEYQKEVCHGRRPQTK